MRVSELAGLTSLPLEQLDALLTDSDIVSVLPVDVGRPDQGSVLVATERRLGIVGHHKGSAREGLVTLWAPWDRVRLETGGGAGSTATGDPSTSRLVVRVGERRFLAALEGAAGKAAVDDFVLAFESPHQKRGAPSS